MIFNILKFYFYFIEKKNCLECFIVEWKQCFSRIFLYRFYWTYYFRSANFKEFEGILRNLKEYEYEGILKEY